MNSNRSEFVRISDRLAVLQRDLTCDHGGPVAVDALDQAAPSGGEVEDHLGGVEAQGVQVHEVEIGALAGLDRAPVGEAVGGGRARRLQVDRLLDR